MTRDVQFSFDFEDLVQRLLNGEQTIVGLETVQLSDISSDVRLCHCYGNSGARSLREFIELRERRFTLRNYGRISEKKLRDALVSYLQRNLSQLTTQSPQTDHAKLVARVIASRCPWSVISESEWQTFREQLKDSELRHKHLYPLAAQLKCYWPFALKRGPNNDTVNKYLRYSLCELKGLRGFGRRKLCSYIACVIHLCGSVATAVRDSTPTNSNLKSTVLFAWENTKLTKNEKAVIEQRFGIHTRKHTLEELGAVFGLTRERIRQIEKKAITKLRLSECMNGAERLLYSQRFEIWQSLVGSAKCIRKTSNLDQLEDDLPFEVHLAIELCAERRNRGINRPAIGDWLSANFRNDESNWYMADDSSGSQEDGKDTHINAALASVMSRL